MPGKLAGPETGWPAEGACVVLGKRPRGVQGSESGRPPVRPGCGGKCLARELW